jgi:GGDEF domain-containing protein
VNPAFEPTAVLGAQRPVDWSDTHPAGLVRALQAAGALLAVLAVAWGLAVALGEPEQASTAWISVVCAAVAAALLRIAAARERRWAAGQGLIDLSSGLYNRQGLCHAAEAHATRSSIDGRPLGLVVLDFADLVEVRDIYGREVSRKLQLHVVRRVRALAGMHGIAARTGKAQFAVLMPRAGREKLQAIVQRQLGKPSRIEFDAGDSEIVLVPDILCDTLREDHDSIDDLYRELATRLAEMRERELRRVLHLQRERERHSRPMSLPPSRP